MAIQRFIATLRNRISAFGRAEQGNVAITFGIAIIPIIGMVGVALDYSRANAVRTDLQAALDSAALMLAKEVDGLNKKQTAQKANDYFKAAFNRPEALTITVTPDYNRGKSSLTLTATTAVDTTITRLFGMSQLPIAANSEVVSGTTKKIEIALVLDNTGSMAKQGRLTALIEASRLFIDTMKKASKKPGDVKIAVIPFDTHVNIGVANSGKPWIDWSLMPNAGSGGTVGTTQTWDDANDFGDRDDDTRYDDDRTAAWNGCVIDRAQPHDVQDSAPGGNASTWYPAENCTLSTLLPLTSDWTAMHAAIDKMKANGKTNLAIGLVWGLHALSHKEPLTEASGAKKDVDKYVVFLTDGMNTQNRWTTKPADIDARTKLACDNIKAADIRLYTVRLMEGNEALLRSCATSPAMYYNVTAANQLMTVFETIAKTLTQLRIAR
jgi:Flp pilus assembly protein TadG